MRSASSRVNVAMVAALGGVAIVSILSLPVLVQTLRGVAYGPSSLDNMRIGLDAIVRTVWAPLLIGLLATALALPASWWMRRARGAVVAMLLAPLLAPSYLVYASWGLLRAPGTWLGDVVAAAPPSFVRTASDIQAIGGLALWAWPVGAVTLAIWTRRVDQESVDAVRSGGGSALRALRFILREIRWGLLASVAIIAVIMLGSAVPLHVAQVETYTIAIWRLLDETGGSAVVWLAALPLLGIALLGGIILSTVIAKARPIRSTHAMPASIPAAVRAIAIAVWALSVVVPLIVFVSSLRDMRSLTRFWTTSGDAAVSSLLTGVAVAVLVLCVGAIMSIARSAAASGANRVSTPSLVLWLALAIMPGVLIGEAILRTSILTPGFAWMTESRAGTVAAHVTRFGFVGATVAAMLCAVEPSELADIRRLHARSTFRAWCVSVAPWQAAGLVGAALATFALSVHEIESAIIVTPPGAENLPRHLLNLLHYNRVEELTAASVWLLGIGLLLGVVVVWLSRVQWTRVRTGQLGAVGIVLATMISGCERTIPSGAPINVRAVIGEAGLAPGQFLTPRAVDTGDGSLWVIDRSGRVQRVDPETGDSDAWEMPAFDNGYPCGITFGPDGLLYIADTHENRIMVFRPSEQGAELVREIGEYGTGDGQFVYPTDIAIQTNLDDGSIERFYVCEYGGNDRVSIFDADWNFLHAFGKEGTGAGVEFARPQSILFDAQRGELLVVDAANHRVGRFSPEGELLQWFGGVDALPGSELGEFRYPYGCAMLPDGSVLVLEFGNNRVQRIDWETGAGLGAWGVPGRGDGELAQPWGVAVLDGVIYVADAGNQRVLAFDVPRDAMRQRSAP